MVGEGDDVHERRANLQVGFVQEPCKWGEEATGPCRARAMQARVHGAKPCRHEEKKRKKPLGFAREKKKGAGR